jgi:hypothetical protein
MHSKKSAISLSWMVLPFPTVGSLVIVFQVRNSVRPMHLFGRNRDHDYYFGRGIFSFLCLETGDSRRQVWIRSSVPLSLLELRGSAEPPYARPNANVEEGHNCRSSVAHLCLVCVEFLPKLDNKSPWHPPGRHLRIVFRAPPHQPGARTCCLQEGISVTDICC